MQIILLVHARSYAGFSAAPGCTGHTDRLPWQPGRTMNALELLGYLGGVLVFSTFYLKTMIPLRVVAIGSNVVYIAYSAMSGLVPILLLHALLMPLNIWRLIQVKQLIRKVRASTQNGLT